MAFTGWSEQAFEVLLHLDGEPTEDQRERLRRQREQLVRAPMIELLNDVADADERYQDFSVWGYGKTVWWWQHQIGIVRQRGGHEMGLRFDLDGLHVSGTWSNRELAAFRAAIADARSGPALADVLADLERKRYEITGDVMSRVPRGFAADHPRGELLRHRSLRVTRPLRDEDCLHSPAAVAEVLAVFAELRPFMQWLIEYVPVRT